MDYYASFVAVMSGLIIFPACFSYGVDPGSGPNLLFVSLPNVFIHMPYGQIWGSLFFLFMIFASFSTVFLFKLNNSPKQVVKFSKIAITVEKDANIRFRRFHY